MKKYNGTSLLYIISSICGIIALVEMFNGRSAFEPFCESLLIFNTALLSEKGK